MDAEESGAIIAIDPGNEKSAFVVWDGQTIFNKGILENNELAFMLRRNNPPHRRAIIEMIASYGMPVGKTVFETCVWIGRFMECSPQHALIYRMDVKMHLCHTTRAKDSNIRQALIDRLGPPGVKASQGVTYGVKKDIWAALSVAVAWWDMHRVAK